MNRLNALESLAESVVFSTATPSTLKSLGLELKEGKTFEDVMGAKHLRPGQQPGDFDRMIAHVENNLKEITA